MKVIINGLIIFCLTGCIQRSLVKPVQIHELSSDELCLALGTYNNDSKRVLEIYDEINKRTKEVNEVNNERCHALEIKAKEDSKGVTSNTKPLNNHYSPGPSGIRNYESFLHQLNEVYRIHGEPKSRPTLYKIDSNPFPK